MQCARFRSRDVLPAILVVGFLFFDAAMPLVIARLPEVPAVLMLAKGVVVAENWLLAMWAALGPAPWIKRVAISLLLSVASAGLFEHGLIHITTWGFTPGIRQIFLAPMELIALAFPLLVLRGWRGWRLVSGRAVSIAGAQRFSLRQLFLATALVAAAVAFAQLGLVELPGLDFQRSMLISDCVQCVIMSLTVVIPLTWLCLRVRFHRAVAWLGCLTVATNSLALALMHHSWSGRQLEEGFAGLAYCDAALLTFAGILLLLRRVGLHSLAAARLFGEQGQAEPVVNLL